MAVRPVARMGANVLKARAADVTDFTDPDLSALIDDMVETMIAVHGIGLAAPQVFDSRRVVIFFVPAARNAGIEVPLTVMINPVITPISDARNDDWEACLSVPGLTGSVPRWSSIRYTFQDLRGVVHEREAHGFHARVVQHECDHLDGTLYPMRMTDMSTLAFVDALKAEAEARGEKLEIEEEGAMVEADEAVGDTDTALSVTRDDVLALRREARARTP
ncbi:MAG: peptide deformylase [Rhodospirillaceae bacterium]|nr:peptide deformylase [Rhodospirillaceae bacterium]